MISSGALKPHLRRCNWEHTFPRWDFTHLCIFVLSPTIKVLFYFQLALTCSDPQVEFECINPKKSKKKNYKNSGVICIKHCQVRVLKWWNLRHIFSLSIGQFFSLFLIYLSHTNVCTLCLHNVYSLSWWRSIPSWIISWGAVKSTSLWVNTRCYYFNIFMFTFLNEKIKHVCISKTNSYRIYFLTVLKLLPANVEKLCIYCVTCLSFACDHWAASCIFIFLLSLTRARLPLTSQALTGIRGLPSPSTISTLKAIMSTWAPSGPWVMSSRTMTGKLKLQLTEIMSESDWFDSLATVFGFILSQPYSVFISCHFLIFRLIFYVRSWWEEIWGN